MDGARTHPANSSSSGNNASPRIRNHTQSARAQRGIESSRCAHIPSAASRDKYANQKHHHAVPRFVLARQERLNHMAHIYSLVCCRFLPVSQCETRDAPTNSRNADRARRSAQECAHADVDAKICTQGVCAADPTCYPYTHTHTHSLMRVRDQLRRIRTLHIVQHIFPLERRRWRSAEQRFVCACLTNHLVDGTLKSLKSRESDPGPAVLSDIIYVQRFSIYI